MATVMAVTTVVVTGVGYILYRFVARSEQIPAIAREDVPAIPALGEGAA
jgi:hypothetical protein